MKNQPADSQPPKGERGGFHRPPFRTVEEVIASVQLPESQIPLGPWWPNSQEPITDED